jgi:mono/diheme cytochrome c family protein
MRGWIAFPLLTLLISCSGLSGDAPTAPSAPTPPELAKGEAIYDRNCARCHGIRGTGTSFGPPFLSKIYEPSHHGDPAFFLAIRRGVQAHHWNFGNMPPYPNLTESDAEEIVRYIRWFQKEGGVY